MSDVPAVNTDNNNNDDAVSIEERDVSNVRVKKNILRKRIEINFDSDSKPPSRHNKPDQVFPYSRLTGKLGKLRIPSYKYAYKIKSWDRAVDLVPKEAWRKMREKGYDISIAKEVYRDKYDEELC